MNLLTLLQRMGPSVTQGCEPWLPISNDKIKHSITSHIDKVWQKRWDMESTCKIARAFLPQVDRSRLNHVKRESVLNLQLMMAILTNHGFFGTHLNKLNKDYDLTCSLCHRGKETSHHIYSECSETVHFRVREQKSPGEILRWFSGKFYLMHLYDTNKLKYEELKTLSNPRGHEGQQLPDNGWDRDTCGVPRLAGQPHWPRRTGLRESTIAWRARSDQGGATNKRSALMWQRGAGAILWKIIHDVSYRSIFICIYIIKILSRSPIRKYRLNYEKWITDIIISLTKKVNSSYTLWYCNMNYKWKKWDNRNYFNLQYIFNTLDSWEHAAGLPFSKQCK